MDSSDQKSNFDRMIFELLSDNEILSSDELEALNKQWQECGDLTSVLRFGNEDSTIVESIQVAERFFVEKDVDLELLKEGLENELKTGERLASFMKSQLANHNFGNASSKGFKPGQILSARVVGRQKDGYTFVELSTKMHGFLQTQSRHQIGEELKVHFVGWDQGTLLVTEKFFAESQDSGEEAEDAGNVIPFRRKDKPSDPDEA